MLKIATIVAATLAASASAAAPARFTDLQFLRAARCEALITSPALGGGDGTAIKAVLKAQRQGRVDYIYDRADQTRDDAARQARHAGPDQKASLIAERDTVCRDLIGGMTARTTSGATGGPAAP